MATPASVGSSKVGSPNSQTVSADVTQLALGTRRLRKAYAKHLAVAGLELSVPEVFRLVRSLVVTSVYVEHAEIAS